METISLSKTDKEIVLFKLYKNKVIIKQQEFLFFDLPTRQIAIFFSNLPHSPLLDKMPTLSCTNISKTYRFGFLQQKKKCAIKNVSFAVRSNEVFGIIGPNGAGKSSILKVIMGFVLPDKGTSLIDDTPATSASGRQDLGYLPENPSLYPHLSPREHLQFACRIAGTYGHDATHKIISSLETVALVDEIDTPVGRFSKGMTQRAALAYALLLTPRILILDEPMSGLDPIGRQLIIDIIQKMQQQGTTILFCSHILSDVERICDRIAIMNSGELIAITTPDDLKSYHARKHHKSIKTPLETYFLDIIQGEDN